MFCDYNFLEFCCFRAMTQQSIFTARRYAIKRGICRRRVSVCLSHSGIVSKRLKVGQHRDFKFSTLVGRS